MAFAHRLVQPVRVAEKSRPPPRPLTPAAPVVRPAAARVPTAPRAAPNPFAAPLPFASTEPDERLARLEKRVAELERQQEASGWEGTAPAAAPAAVAAAVPALPARAAEPDRREEIVALVKAAVDEAVSAQRAEWERKEKAREAPRSIAPDVRWSAPAPAAPPWGEAAPAPVKASVTVAPVSAALPPVPARAMSPAIIVDRVETPRIDIPSPREPLGFDIPEGLDGSARRRKVGWAAFLFLLFLVGGLLSSMLLSRNR